jgi:hypothetical protein
MKITSKLANLMMAKIILLSACSDLCFAQDVYREQEVSMRTTAPRKLLVDGAFLIERTNSIEGRIEPQGTGFYIGVEGITYGVTARHVVQAFDSKSGTWGDLVRPLYIRSRPVQTNVPPSQIHKEIGLQVPYDHLFIFHTNSTLDVAVFPVFFFANMTDRIALGSVDSLQSDENVLVGEDVNVLGFPGPLGFDRGEPVVRSGTICYKLNPYIYLLDANLWPGDSGGLVCSKPYFGVPKDNPNRYQWNAGGKVLGIEHGPLDLGPLMNLPPELHGFQIIYSGQAIKEIFESPAFKDAQRAIKASAEKH